MKVKDAFGVDGEGLEIDPGPVSPKRKTGGFGLWLNCAREC